MAEVKEDTKVLKEKTDTEHAMTDKKHDIDSGSGSENGEKPVREKLKKTDLEEISSETTQSAALVNGVPAEGETGKLKKKRSYKDLAHEDGNEPLTPSEGTHARKKTRETGTPTTKASGSALRNTEIPAEDDAEAKHSDVDSDKIIVTPPSSGDEAMADISSGSKIKKKRSSEEMAGSQDEMQRSPKIAATYAEKDRRSLSAPPSDNESKAEDVKAEDISKTDPPRSVPQPDLLSEKSTTTGIPSGSGFANTSSTSPFAALASDKSKSSAISPQPQTSSSAFAGSGFAAMANSSSPFGSIAKAKSPPVEEKPQTSASAFASSGFASLTGSTSAFGSSTGASKPLSSFATSSFASDTSKSGFGGGSTAFGSAFGSGFGGTSKLSSFAAPVGDSKVGQSSAAKPFGAPEASDDEDDGDDKSDNAEEDSEDIESSFGGPSNEGQSAFKIRNDQTTGEEGESTAFFSPNAKLYQKTSAGWSERGSGPFKLNHKITNNSNEPDPESASQPDLLDLQPGDATVEARFIMRNAATHKVLVNARIFKEMIIGDHKGGEPHKKTELLFSAAGEKGVEIYLLRLGKKDDSKELYDQVKKIQELL